MRSLIRSITRQTKKNPAFTVAPGYNPSTKLVQRSWVWMGQFRQEWFLLKVQLWAITLHWLFKQIQHWSQVCNSFSRIIWSILAQQSIWMIK